MKEQLDTDEFWQAIATAMAKWLYQQTRDDESDFLTPEADLLVQSASIVYFCALQSLGDPRSYSTEKELSLTISVQLASVVKIEPAMAYMMSSRKNNSNLSKLFCDLFPESKKEL